MENKLKEYFSSLHNRAQNIDENDMCSDLDKSVLLAKLNVPLSHRKVSENYNVLFNVCHFQVVQPRISNVEVALLEKYHFNTLENTTISSMNNQIQQLKEWSLSDDDKLRADADKIFEIRVKELKFMRSTNYVSVSNETNKGYKALELYIKNVSMFYTIK